MNVKLFLLVMLFLCAVPVMAQSNDQAEHAILPEQCRADIHLWNSQNKDDFTKLSFVELQKRVNETRDCLGIDRGTGEASSEYGQDSVEYKTMMLIFTALSEQRLLAFVKRHDGLKTFLDEDAAGIR
jgi:hypothetical protein